LILGTLLEAIEQRSSRITVAVWIFSESLIFLAVAFWLVYHRVCAFRETERVLF
jgi:hypothetical protein